MRHSDFIVYVDENGDHSLARIDPLYPLFVLSLCVFRKTTYNARVAPALRQLKFATFGHDMVVLHETDIRKRAGVFGQLGRDGCEQFLEALTDLIAAADFHVVPAIIDKRTLQAGQGGAPHVYHLALEAALGMLRDYLLRMDQQQRLVHIVCEARGAKEDADLCHAFRRFADHSAESGHGIKFALVVADKRTNSEGLQLADLTARPMGLSILRPEQSNRAAAIIRSKLSGPLSILNHLG